MFSAGSRNKILIFSYLFFISKQALHQNNITFNSLFMGMFMALSAVIGKSEKEVADSLKNYALSAEGGLEGAALSYDDANCCVIEEASGNTSVMYPDGYLEWDASSEFLSRELKAPVFSFHIHDGDLWMYILYVNGEVADQFNPIPDYWEEAISQEEMDAWKGSAETVSMHVPGITPSEIANYLSKWNTELDEMPRAYPDDENVQEDWQLLDFMRKLSLPYPLNEDWEPKGTTYRLWTKELALPQENTSPVNPPSEPKKPWWKFG